MPLITEKVAQNAATCLQFVSDVVNSVDRNSVLDEQLDALVKSLCNVAPHIGDFEKVYGQKPYDFFMENLKNK